MLTLTVERLRDVLNYDPETGLFRWKRMLALRGKVGAVAGHKDDKRGRGRVHIRIDGGLYLAHRLAWLYVHGKWPDGEIDHINRDSADNRLVNLRDVSHQQNLWNMSVHRDSASGLKGVTYDRKRNAWTAQIYIQGKSKYLGRFKSKEEAVAAYQAAAKANFGEFAADTGMQ